MKLTLHVTDLDQLVWYNRIESKTSDDLIESLLRTSEPNEQMLMGTAWHSILEDPPDEIDTIENGGFTFRVDFDGEIVLPQIREIRATKTYLVDGVEVTLTGGCDGVTATKVTDHKLTFKPNPGNYFGSYQWRAYLDIYDANVFEYLIYPAVKNGGVVVIKDVISLKMYRYPQMIDDLVYGIQELLWFIRTHVPEMITS